LFICGHILIAGFSKLITMFVCQGYEIGPQTPAAGTLPIKLYPIYVEAIDILSSKLGK